MHRIGRTGRAEEKGNTILFYTDKEEESKIAIESLMNYKIPQTNFPIDVDVSEQLLPEERDRPRISKNRSTEIVLEMLVFMRKREKY